MSVPSLAAIRRRADGRSFERGEEYFAEGRVGRLERIGADAVRASVDGTQRYRVKVALSADGELDFGCDCPVGREGAVCKHCVAAGLAWRAQRGERKRDERVGRKELHAYLGAQTHGALVGLVLEAADADERFGDRLLMAAATEGTRAAKLATFRASIDGAVGTRGFVAYAEMWDYAAGIDDAIQGLAKLLADGHAADVVELAEYALSAVEGALQEVDDSSGHMGGILERLQELHLRACRRAKPDQVALAQRLFAWELHGDWDTFSGAGEAYARVLGRAGRARYRELAESAWAKVPALGSGDQRSHGGQRFAITRIMESLADDVDELVAVMARDLASGYQFLRIAEAYRAAGRGDDALAWAKRGRDSFPDAPDRRLIEFLADEHASRGEHAEATGLMWEEFARRPCLEMYAKLKQHAEPGGEWTQRRSLALLLMRAGLTREAAERQARPRAGREPDRSELVRVFLWEDDGDAAWREAQEGGCGSTLWLELAERRRRDHPDDALAVYQARVDPTIARKNNDAYRQALAHVREIRALLSALGRGGEFPAYVAELRARHKPKRNLVKLLDAL